MTENEIASLSNPSAYGELLALCKGGPKKNVAVPSKDLAKATNDREFCMLAATNVPELSFYLKLFDLTDWFSANAPSAPALGDKMAAQTYLNTCLTLLKNHVLTINFVTIQKLISDLTLKYATQFNGKIIHTSVEDTGMFAQQDNTIQPHLSSRSLKAKGIHLALEQKSLDLEGGFQRLMKIVENDSLLQEAQFPSELQQKIKDAFLLVLGNIKTLQPQRVDHRLRQILMPSGNDYIALSPLASGHMNSVISDAAYKYETTEYSNKPANFKYFEKIEFLVGGAISRNASYHYQHPGFQKPLYFKAPQRNNDIHKVWSFIHNSWIPRITYKDAKAIAEQLKTFALSNTTNDSASTLAVKIQSTYTLASLVDDCHNQAIELSDSLAIQSVKIGDIDKLVDEDVLNEYRRDELSVLDKSILYQNFGSDYQLALSQTIVQVLWSILEKSEHTAGLLSGQNTRLRVEGAIQNIMRTL